MQTENSTIVYFHTGRGGRFNNPGHTIFCGNKNILDVLRICDNSGQSNFINKENTAAVYAMLRKRNLPNIESLFEKCLDADDFSEFENKTGIKMGKDIYTDCNGNEIISVEDAETGIGELSWDGSYDTDTFKLLSDCSDGDLNLIESSDECNKYSLLQEYFTEVAGLEIDWTKFNGNYDALIYDYFNSTVDISEFYEEQEVN